jgi:hypothetical protein
VPCLFAAENKKVGSGSEFLPQANIFSDDQQWEVRVSQVKVFPDTMEYSG